MKLDGQRKESVKKKTRQHESPVDKETRLAKKRDAMRMKRQNETAEQKEQRLANARAYKKTY